MRQRSILIVDANAALRRLLTVYLMETGFATFQAPDGDSAIRLALTERVDLILLEAMLPGRSGIFVLREIRSRRALPVILMSTLSETELRELASDADDYLHKPYRPKDVVASVKTILASDGP